MSSERSATTADPLLAPYLTATDDEIARLLLGEILDTLAAPLVLKILQRQLGGRAARVSPAEIEDLQADVLLKLQILLVAVRRGEREAPQSLPDYVAVTAFRAAAGFQMARQPERTRLRDRVRYVLRRDEGLTHWAGADRQTLCGLNRHRDGTALAASAQLAEIVPAATARHGGGWGQFPGLVREILTRLDTACGLEELVDALASALGVVEPLGGGRIEPPGSPANGSSPEFVDPERSALDRLEAHQQVSALWDEVKQLPSNQLFALLINLRGEGDEAPLEQFLLSGVVGGPELAAALRLAIPELEELLPTLPRDDAWIAQRLDLTRQQVINLRKSARLRLARRLRGIFGGLG